tara:strand:- start:750 stop:1022 length:273 start_codon:yes stop_codon:yes gene_type:complete
MKYETFEKLREENIKSLNENDMVNNPTHYNHNKHGVECIEAIQASMSDEEFRGYLKGNTIKYLWRYGYKGKPEQDLLKAQWYLNKLLDTF